LIHQNSEISNVLIDHVYNVCSCICI